MANLTTRSLTVSTVSTDNLNKGSALTISEMDSNFLNLNTDKLEISGTQTFSGDLTITSETSSAVGSLIFKEAADNGTDAITLKAPTSTAAYTITLPATAPTNGYGLTTDGSGNLSWTASAGDITEVIAGAGMTGGAASGSATLNVIAGNGITVNADDVEIDTSVVTTLTGTQTLTNKSIDADNNTITNLEVDNLKSGVLDTDITAVSASDDTLASAKAIKTYVDAEVPDDTDGLSEGSTNLYYTDARFDTRLGTKTTDNLTEGSTNLYFTNTRADARIGLASINDLSDVDTTGIANNKILKYNSTSGNWEIADDVDTEDNLSNNDTDDLAEGSTNLYYTDARFDTRLATKSTTDISEGTNLYYTDSRFDTRLNAKTTDNLAEGSINLYYTDARAQAVSINNLSEDTTPELGGTLDILGNDIKSSTANVVISADATDTNVILKTKDAGGTLNTHSTFSNNPRIENVTDGTPGVNQTLYDTIIDTNGIRIGSSNDNFSNDGNAPDTDSNFPTTGLIISNGTKKTWPQIALTSYGGSNPLHNRTGSHPEYPNGLINFKAARGTESTPTAIQSGDNIGSFQFNSYDGSYFGGAGGGTPRSSASIEVKANENHSTTNDRGAKVTFNVMPTGGDGSKTGRDTVIEAEGDGVRIGNLTNSKYLDVDVANSQLVLNTTNKITTGTDEDLTIEPNGTGTVKLGKGLDVNGQSIITTSNGDITLAPNGDGDVKINSGGSSSDSILEMYNGDKQGIIIHPNASGSYTTAAGGTHGMLYHNGLQVEENGDYRYPSVVLKNNSINGYPYLWAAKARPAGGTDYTTDAYMNNNEILFRYYGAPYKGDASAGQEYFTAGALCDMKAAENHSNGNLGCKIEFGTINTGSTSNTTKMTIGNQVTMNSLLELKAYASTALPTGVNGAIIAISDNNYKPAYYNGSAWTYIGTDGAV